MEKLVSTEYDLDGAEVIVKEESWNGLEETESQNNEKKHPATVVLVAVEGAEEYPATADQLSLDEEEQQWCPYKKRRVVVEREFEPSEEEEIGVLESPVSQSKTSIHTSLSMDENVIPAQSVVSEDGQMCGICGDVFSKCSNPDVHRRLNASELAYHCNVCNSTFTSRRLLRDHKRNHIGYHTIIDKHPSAGILEFNMVRDKRVRSPNLSIREKELLFALAKKHLTVIECKKTDAFSQGIKANEWNKIAEQFNSRSCEFYRTAGSLHNCWENWKKRARKASVTEKPDGSMTGCGSAKKYLDDNLMERIRAILQISTENLDNILNRDTNTVSKGSPSGEEITSQVTRLSEETTFPNGRRNCSSPSVSRGSVSESLECTRESTLHFALRSGQRSSQSHSSSVPGCVPIITTPCSAHPSSSHRHVEAAQCNGVHTSTQTVWCPMETPRPRGSAHTSTQTRLSPVVHTSTQTVLLPSVDTTVPPTTCSTEVTRCRKRQYYSERTHKQCAAMSLMREKVKALSSMRKMAMDEHDMVQQCFKMKMQSEEQRMKIEQTKLEVENEILEQEKIKKKILLLQLQKLEKQ